MTGFLTALLLLVPTANAQETDDGASAPAAADDSQLGVNLRYRYMFAPRAIVNAWYSDTKHWEEANAGQPYEGMERPGIGAHVIGLEFAIEPRPASFLIYAEYWNVKMGEGYWDDRDSGAPDVTDGDWLKPNKLGMVAAGVDFGHEFPVSDTASDVWVGFRMGGGLGIGIPTGTIQQWHPGADFSTELTNDCEPSLHAVDRHGVCPADEELTVPPVLPILDMDLGWRFHFMDTGLLRIDAGIHDMFYLGVGAGAVF